MWGAYEPPAVGVELRCVFILQGKLKNALRFGCGWIIHGNGGRGAVKAFIFTVLPLAVRLSGAFRVMGWIGVRRHVIIVSRILIPHGRWARANGARQLHFPCRFTFRPRNYCNVVDPYPLFCILVFLSCWSTCTQSIPKPSWLSAGDMRGTT